MGTAATVFFAKLLVCVVAFVLLTIVELVATGFKVINAVFFAENTAGTVARLFPGLGRNDQAVEELQLRARTTNGTTRPPISIGYWSPSDD